MFKLLIFVLIAITLILLSLFIDGLMGLYKKEKEEAKNTVREGIIGYMDQTFGFEMAKVFKSIHDAEGNVRYLVYLPQYAWFKSPNYQWYEVYATHNGYQHNKVER
ncbi:hypothetical protein [Bacillus sp. OTU2372]|uniref:hypothetical protein n=1 Tax=Bacillus sp. OTU2372 TaxID=3043858 RepID=UPI00313BB48B